jgi:hypothetical protein
LGFLQTLNHLNKTGRKAVRIVFAVERLAASQFQFAEIVQPSNPFAQ